MRLGLLGPVSQGASNAALEAAADFLLTAQGVTRVLYLGDDDALDRVVERRARDIVTGDPSDDAAWTRAEHLVRDGTPEAIDAFIEAERRRRSLRVFESLPRPALRTVEMVGDRLTVLIFDKANLDEEDIFPAALLVYGKGEGCLAKRIGTRWFLSPGRLGLEGGVCVLDESGEELVAHFFNQKGSPVLSERLPNAAAAKLKVQGGA
ncbi:MAG: hypothetical protein U0235_11865 [Polyangiaceae bacterium]